MPGLGEGRFDGQNTKLTTYHLIIQLQSDVSSHLRQNGRERISFEGYQPRRSHLPGGSHQEYGRAAQRKSTPSYPKENLPEIYEHNQRTRDYLLDLP